jgi:hypothetical protein
MVGVSEAPSRRVMLNEVKHLGTPKTELLGAEILRWRSE